MEFRRKAVLNSILAYGAKFSLKYLGPAVGSTEIRHFLSPCPGCCARTSADHMINLILMVSLMKSLEFVP